MEQWQDILNRIWTRCDDSDWWRQESIWQNDSDFSRPTEAAAVASVRQQARAPKGVDPDDYAVALELQAEAAARAQREQQRAAVVAGAGFSRVRKSALAAAAAPTTTRSSTPPTRTRPRGRRFRNGVPI